MTRVARIHSTDGVYYRRYTSVPSPWLKVGYKLGAVVGVAKAGRISVGPITRREGEPFANITAGTPDDAEQILERHGAIIMDWDPQTNSPAVVQS